MKLYEALEKQLKKEPNFVTDNGELKKWVVIDRARNFDEELIELLLQNKKLKETFFVKVKDVLVFKQNLFIDFLEQKNYLNDSYTKFKNKIGLTIDGKFLKQRNEVALVWPFKDCILEGGQSREEDKREEIFFNEILAQAMNYLEAYNLPTGLLINFGAKSLQFKRLFNKSWQSKNLSNQGSDNLRK